VCLVLEITTPTFGRSRTGRRTGRRRRRLRRSNRRRRVRGRRTPWSVHACVPVGCFACNLYDGLNGRSKIIATLNKYSFCRQFQSIKLRNTTRGGVKSENSQKRELGTCTCSCHKFASQNTCTCLQVTFFFYILFFCFMLYVCFSSCVGVCVCVCVCACVLGGCFSNISRKKSYRKL
jgi:hypothetical protein